MQYIDSDEKVFAFEAIEACGATYNYFKRMKGNWFLVKIVVSD